MEGARVQAQSWALLKLQRIKNEYEPTDYKRGLYQTKPCAAPWSLLGPNRPNYCNIGKLFQSFLNIDCGHVKEYTLNTFDGLLKSHSSLRQQQEIKSSSSEGYVPLIVPKLYHETSACSNSNQSVLLGEANFY